MIHIVVSINRSTGTVNYLAGWRDAKQAYADAMVYCTHTCGVWHAIVDQQKYVNELLDEVLSIKPCPVQG